MHFEALKIAARANPGDDTYEIPLWLPCTVGETTAGSTHAPADHPQAPQGGLRDGCRVWSQVRVCQCVAAHGVSGTGR